jgi:cellulose synthase/poly-beta-1,6-N-acetylglucosamine synthase-like glycosyltransferase
MGVTLSIYIALLTLLSAVSVHRMLLALAARRLRNATPDVPREWPSVLVQLPMYNERYVAERLIDAVCELDYPPEKLTIQVLDDSRDETVDIAAARVALWQSRGLQIEHVRRPDRVAFKAGALAYGLTKSDAELVAIFDADFVPAADFVKLLVPHFNDPGIGMVQARWAHLNRNDSPVTESQAILLDGHFVNEHGGRAALGSFFNFNGTAGMWRRNCIDDAGGWSGQTLTEDLDLSYRAQLKGWKFVYRQDVEVPAELPADVNAFKTQQHRWAKGSTETACALLPTIWRHPTLSLRHRCEATFHLAGNIAYPMVLLLAVLMPFAITSRYELLSWKLMVMDGLMFVGSAASLITFYSLAEKSVGHGDRILRRLPMTLALGVGLAVNNSRAVFEALLGKKTEFARTPKWGNRDARRVDPAYLLSANWQALIEFVLGAYMVCAMAVSAANNRFVPLPFMGIFALGFLTLALGSLRKAFLTRFPAVEKASLTASPHASTIAEPHHPAADHG